MRENIGCDICTSYGSFTWRFKVLLRTLLDCLFIWLQWEIYPYKAVIPEVFECTRVPCPHTVECWPSRVKEKTIFFHYMYIAAIITCLINLAELFYIGPRRIVRAFTCCIRSKDLKSGFDQPTPTKSTDGNIFLYVWHWLFILETYL